MFGLGSERKIQAAADAAYSGLQPLCAPYQLEGTLVKAILSDAYVAGFLATHVSGVCAYTAREHGLDEHEARQVILAVLQKLYVERNVYGCSTTISDIAARVDRLSRSNDAQFILGRSRGLKFVSYATGREDIRSDSDYEKAVRLAREAGAPSPTDVMTVLSSLDRIWFGNYMMERFPASPF